MIKFIVVFLAAASLDMIWAGYTYAITKLHPYLASFYAMLILALGAIGITAYVDDIFYLIPASLGAGLGTFIMVSREKKK